MNASELHIGLDYEAGYQIIINISYALVRIDCTWLWVKEMRSGDNCEYLTRLMNDQVSIIEGVLYIKGDDLLLTIQGGYILGTLFQPRYYKNRTYVKKHKKAI